MANIQVHFNPGARASLESMNEAMTRALARSAARIAQSMRRPETVLVNELRTSLTDAEVIEPGCFDAWFDTKPEQPSGPQQLVCVRPMPNGWGR